MPPALTAGRTLLTLVAINTAVGPYIADWSLSHVLNPNWPPHARFHNGQTMSLGLCLGLLTGYFAWRPLFARPALTTGGTTESHTSSTSAPNTIEREGTGMTQRESITISAVMGSLYWIAGLSAILYPGTLWVDPEFGTGAPQRPIFVASILLAWVGWGCEIVRLRSVEGKEKVR